MKNTSYEERKKCCLKELLGQTPRVRQLISQNRLKSQKMGRDHLLNLGDIKNFAICEQKKAGRPQKRAR
jgi:hypothetical protein